MSTLACALLQFIRMHKKALPQISRNHPDLPIQLLFDYERRYRGASQWLNDPSARGVPRDFALSLRNRLRYLMVSLQSARKQFVEAQLSDLFKLPGLEPDAYHEFYRATLAERLTHLARERKGLSLSHAGRYGQLTLKMPNGLATMTHQWDYATEMPAAASGNLGEQLEALELRWREVREAFTTFIKDPANWPSDLQRSQREQERIATITKRLLDSLSPDDFALLRKHPQVFKQHLNTRLA